MRSRYWSSDVCSSDLTSGRAVIYARVSTPVQFEHGCASPVQINRAQEYCDRHDLSVVRIVSDGQSGRTDERRAFQEMERFVLDPRNEVNAVVVYAYSRFYRNFLESEKKIAALEDKGINVISLTQPVPQDCLGRLMRR